MWNVSDLSNYCVPFYYHEPFSAAAARLFFRSLNANNFADKEKCKLYACLLLFYICGATTRYDCVTIFQLSSSDCADWELMRWKIEISLWNSIQTHTHSDRQPAINRETDLTNELLEWGDKKLSIFRVDVPSNYMKCDYGIASFYYY